MGFMIVCVCPCLATTGGRQKATVNPSVICDSGGPFTRVKWIGGKERFPQRVRRRSPPVSGPAYKEGSPPLGRATRNMHHPQTRTHTNHPRANGASGAA